MGRTEPGNVPLRGTVIGFPRDPLLILSCVGERVEGTLRLLWLFISIPGASVRQGVRLLMF